MSPQEIENLCLTALNREQSTVVLQFPRGNRFPHKFPVGERVRETPTYSSYAFPPKRILQWLRENGYIQGQKAPQEKFEKGQAARA
jgi:hypothetical protein